ncbi:MAG: TlpA disulfide reductase family protein [Pyrinomonadaceae bacterium]
MKQVFSNLLLLTVFAVVFSGLTSCTDTASSQRGPIDETAPPSVAANSDVVKSKSEYPPIASAVATAEIKNLDGTVFTVNDRKGKVILLNLWATWCGPCRAEMPALVRMQEKHSAQGFEVIGLNTDEEEVDKINTFAGSMKLNYTLAWADTALQSSLLKISKFPGIPQSFLLDREGNLRGVFRGANGADIAKMEETVAKVVGEPQ